MSRHLIKTKYNCELCFYKTKEELIDSDAESWQENLEQHYNCLVPFSLSSYSFPMAKKE